MNIGKFFCFFCTVLLVGFLGGCAEYGTTSQTPFTVVNNMKVLLDFECQGREIVANLAEGKSFPFNLADFYDGGCEITLIAKGHTSTGEPLGMTTHTIRFIGGYRNGPYGRFYGFCIDPYSSRPWVVKQLDPPGDVQNSSRGSR